MFAFEKGVCVLETGVFSFETGLFALEKGVFALEKGVFALETGGFALEKGVCVLETGVVAVLGEWVNPHRERQTIPQGQTSSPHKSVLTPTAKARHNGLTRSPRRLRRRAPHTEHSLGVLREGRGCV